MNKIKTVILGCGSIAGNNYSGFKSRLNHVNEINNNPDFELLACIEKNIKKKIFFKKKYKIPYSFSSLENFLKMKLSYDLIVICTNTESHFKNLMKLLKNNSKNILCEKPICTNYYELKKLSDLIKKKNSNIFVNFNRKEDSTIQNLKKIIYKKNFGEIQFVRCIYGNGLINNGIHLIDLLFFLFGNLKLKQVLKNELKSKKNRQSPSFILKSNKKFPIIVDSLVENEFSIFEIDIIFKNGRIKYNDNGLKIEFFEMVKNKYFTDKKKLSSRPQIMKTEFLRSFKNQYQKIAVVIKNNKYNFEFENFKKVHKLCFETIKKY